MDTAVCVGTRVTYADIALRDYRGIVTSVGRTQHGGDCTVRWTYPSVCTSEECVCNLKVLIQ